MANRETAAAPSGGSLSALPLLLDRLLHQHGVVRADLEEAALHRVLMAFDPNDDGRSIDAHNVSAARAEQLERVVRMAATNRELRRQGLMPLLLHPPPPSSPAQSASDLAASSPLLGVNLLGGQLLRLSDEEHAAIEALGLRPDLYLLIRGDHGQVLGLHLQRDAYARALRACRCKRAVALRNQGDASRAFLGEQLVKIARRSAAYITRKGAA